MSYEKSPGANLEQQRLLMPVKSKIMESKMMESKQEFPKLVSKQTQVQKEVKEPTTKQTKKVNFKKGSEQQQETFNLSNDIFMKNFETCVQSGYRSLKTFEAQKAAEWKEMPKISSKEQKDVEVKTDEINKYKQTFRSGYQDKNTSNMVSDLQITMGIKQPFLVKNGSCLGSIAYDNGYSGLIKEEIKMKYR